uniref:SOSS complex subunit A homolog n=1 Tax=Romanomermis culicivorax TaxID=13658 RepID=A0A915JGQ9_ROMCU
MEDLKLSSLKDEHLVKRKNVAAKIKSLEKKKLSSAINYPSIMQSYSSETTTPAGSRSAKKQSKLFTYSAIESKLDEDERMESCFKSLLIRIKDLSEKETHDALVAMVSYQNSSDEVSLGLLYGILTDAQTAPKFYRDLTLLASNSLNKVLSTVNWMILEMYARLLDTPRVQLIWFVRELVKNNINHADIVCMHLMRVVLAGCYSPQNIGLIDALLTILQENKTWLDKNATLIGYAVFFYLRLIPDHTSSQHEALRNREIRFCISYLRERFMDCLTTIQRELGRALLIVGRIPEFERLWADILYNPTVLSPSFTGVWQLLSYSNPRRNTMNKIVLCRLTVEIERKIYFFLHNVASANQKSYLEWFHRQYLTPLDSQTIRSDLIRYVCCMVHPPNAVLASDVVPRWAFITHLLTTCQNPVEVQLMRLSLFYDWMFFDPEKESIMNIEPAVLVLFNSLKTQPLLASSLMDFVCRLVYNFCAPVSAQIKNCVYLSLRQLQDRKVVPSLSPLLDSNRFDPELQCLVKEIFEEFFNSKEDKKEEFLKSVSTTSHTKVDDTASDSPFSRTDSGLEIEDDKSLDQEKFSDDEMETSATAVTTNSRDNSSQDDEDEDDLDENDYFYPEKCRTKNYTTSTDLINPSDDPMPTPAAESLLQQLDETLRPLVENLQKSSESDVQGDTVYKILQQILTLDNFDEEQASALAECLCGLFKPFFARKVFPLNYDSET